MTDEQDKPRFCALPSNAGLGSGLHLLPEELIGLPDELLRELSSHGASARYEAVITALRNFGGEACLDKLLIALFMETNVLYKRQELINTIHRMSRKGMVIYSGKGVYRLPNVKLRGALQRVPLE